MKYISGFYSELSAEVSSQPFEYRYEVFVNQLGWELDTPCGIERDQFDHDLTLYVVARDEDQQVSGCSRLLPTTEPYLLEKVFPELLNGMDAPKSEKIWELSRFTAFNLKADHPKENAQFSSEIAIELLRNSIQAAKEEGAERIISVSPVGVERLLRKAGFKSHRAGPPIKIDGHLLYACWIDIQ